MIEDSQAFNSHFYVSVLLGCEYCMYVSVYLRQKSPVTVQVPSGKKSNSILSCQDRHIQLYSYMSALLNLHAYRLRHYVIFFCITQNPLKQGTFEETEKQLVHMQQHNRS